MPKIALVMLLGVLVGATWAADPLGQAVDATLNANRADKASQQKVDGLDDQTRTLLDRYRNALWQTQQLNVYAQQLEQLAASQDGEKQSLERQLGEIDRTERELLPLMLRMVDTLGRFVAEDLPFLKQERAERVEILKHLLTDPQTGVAEKYRRILEAYQIEADYGRTLGAERAEVEGRTVDVLRIGRTGMYYLSSDGDAGGTWDAASGKWLKLERKYFGSVKHGLKIAKETAAADLLTLPVPVATGATP